MIHNLTYPFTPAKVRALAVGDLVRVSGKVFTGRDRLHEHLFKGGLCPVKLRSGCIYHCGPVVIRKNNEWSVIAAGPTTSIREERFMPRLIRHYGIGLIIGKGGMGSDTLAACSKHGCVYLDAVGGAAQVLSDHVKKVVGVHFLNEFGATEALWELETLRFPAIVTMDAHGNSLHERIAEKSRRILERLAAK